MTMGDWLPPAIAGLLAASTVGGRRISKGLQPLRIEAADRGEWLLAQPDLPAALRADVEFMLRSMFGFRAVLILMVFVAPLFPVLLAFKGVRDGLRPPQLPNDEAAAHYHRLDKIFWQVALATHPILVPLAMLIFACVAIPTILLIAAIRCQAPVPPGAERFVRAIDDHTRFGGRQLAH